MEILKGNVVAKDIQEQASKIIEELKGNAPVLAIVRVGEDPSDISYETGAKKRMEALGIETRCYTFPRDVSNDTFLENFQAINEDAGVDGILLMRPLPKQIDGNQVEQMLKSEKDVDCITPKSLGKVFMDQETFYPCTAEAVLRMIRYYEGDLTGKKVCIVGRSLVVGKPLAMMLLKANATVTVCHSRTENLKKVCKESDILVTAVGRGKMFDREYVTENSRVYDVGINMTPEGKLCGDCDFDSVAEVCKGITPVPGGVGSVTTSMLALQVCQAALKYRK